MAVEAGRVPRASSMGVVAVYVRRKEPPSMGWGWRLRRALISCAVTIGMVAGMDLALDLGRFWGRGR